jgi:hypothetical protein
VTLKDVAFKASTDLAEYRSALEAPNEQGRPTPQKVLRTLVQFDSPDHVFNGISFVLDDPNLTGIEIGPHLKGKLSEKLYYSNGTITGGNQTLDGIHWQNATFIGTRIRYNGGEVELSNVQFVNCTFEAPPNDRGFQLVNYAALASKRLTIG